MYDIALKNGLVYYDEAFHRVHLYIQGEKISLCTSEDHPAKRIEDCEGLYVLPGLIDPHVHFDLEVDPYRSADDFNSGSIAAAYGGYTSILDFIQPVHHEDEVERAIEDRLRAAKGCHLDYGFHGCLGRFHGSIDKVVHQFKEKGLLGIKVFTTYESSGRQIQVEKLEALLQKDELIMVHAEAEDLIKPFPKHLSAFEDSRPVAAELVALKRLKSLLEGARGKLYIVHISSGTGLKALVDQPIYKESCPQYFVLNSGYYHFSDGAKYLLAPPLRSLKEQHLLQDQFSHLDTIGSDHCPFALQEKLHPFGELPPMGLGSIEFTFPLLFDLFGQEVIDKCSKKVADIFSLTHKGQLKKGYDADLFLFNPHQEMVIGTGHGKGDYSPYQGIRTTGTVLSTMVRGNFVMYNRSFLGGAGRYLGGRNEKNY